MPGQRKPIVADLRSPDLAQATFRIAELAEPSKGGLMTSVEYVERGALANARAVRLIAIKPQLESRQT
jgi:hypothetical protein